ncbi:MAG TPA: helix-turn-helix transcriptional regulator [Candidatus Saccharimonadales bacterium]|nr:helix-turn-helix transcriptional regulator [Candidatus Saccharimonadales bacterium]
MKYDQRRIETFKTWSQLKQELLANPKVKAAYDELEEEFQFADALIRARLEKQLTQSQLAEKAGMKQSAVARLESGKTHPRYKTMTRLAKALDKKISFV